MASNPLDPPEEAHLRDCSNALGEEEVERIWATVNRARARQNRAEAACAALKEALGKMFDAYRTAMGRLESSEDPWNLPAWMQRALSWKSGTDYISGAEYLRLANACRAAFQAEEEFSNLATVANVLDNVPWGGYSCPNEDMAKARVKADALREKALAILKEPVQK